LILRYQLLQYYYLATPIFIVVDAVFGANIRVAALEHYPFLKYAYYIVCIGCGVIMRLEPRLSPVTALIESSVNIFLLILGLLAPYYQLVSQLSSKRMVETDVITSQLVTNFIISGAVWGISFSSNPLVFSVSRRNQSLR
jgi:hypothetical protein